MLIKLCTDIWRDCFDWLSLKDRKKLALKFNEIEDSEFSALCELWLHKWSRDVLLGNISTDNPLPTTELPDNIVGFKSIQINRMDTTVRQFLRTMQPLFQNVNLDWIMTRLATHSHHRRFSVIHRQLLLFLTGGIHMVTLYATGRLFTIREFPAQFFSIERLQLDMWPDSFTFTEEFMELLLLWLCTRRADGHPRMLRIRGIGEEDAFGIEQIRQKFREASSPVCFFIWISANGGIFDDMEETATIQNANTSEQLMIRKQEDADGFGWDYLSIGRCPSELDGQIWMREMLSKTTERTEQRNIQIIFDPIEEAMPEENEEDEEGGLDQPGTSGDKQQS